MLKAYFASSSTLTGLVNETSPHGPIDRLLPGDIVRRQMFDEDISLNIVIPIGIIVWSNLVGEGNGRDVGILWSGGEES